MLEEEVGECGMCLEAGGIPVPLRVLFGSAFVSDSYFILIVSNYLNKLEVGYFLKIVLY